MSSSTVEPDSYFNSTYRHWDAGSEKYTGADALVTALENGWEIDGVVFRQEFWLSGVRPVCVYHFDLVRDGERAKMRVVNNPFLSCFLNSHEDIQVVAINQRKQEERVRFF